MGLLHSKVFSFGDREAPPGGLLVARLGRKLWIKSLPSSPPVGRLLEFYNAAGSPPIAIVNGEVWRDTAALFIPTDLPVGQRLLDLIGDLAPGEVRELVD